MVAGRQRSLVGGLILAAGLAVPAHGSRAAVRLPSSTGPALPAEALESWPLERLAPAVDALRRRDLEAGRERLAASLSRPRAELLLGLHAHQAGEHAQAARWLAAAHDPSGMFDDWRLWALGGSLLEGGDLAGAQRAAQRLLVGWSRSPLYLDAYRRVLEVSRDRGDWLATLRAIEAARQLDLDDALAPLLDVLQWEIASEQGLADLRRETARHLLAWHPLTAAELQAAELFRRPDGSLPWSEILTPGELLLRAERLLDAGVADGALQSLAEVPARDRGFDWSILEARSLAADRRGREALGVLAEAPAAPRDRLTELWTTRAEAALEAARVRRGRDNADADTRRAWRDSAWRDLWQIALRGEQSERAGALRRLYSMADVEDNFDLALGILKRLRRERPDDITGYRDLWKLGWRAYVRDDMTVAIGIWRELANLYPEVSTARQGLYWSAVAHGRLGDHERSRRMLLDILSADTMDFYARHAARRLGVVARRGAAVEASIPWPSDPRLARAALLSELGLDTLADAELDRLRSEADPAAASALDGLILARRGERRPSIQAIWEAFRVLGKPGQTAVPAAVRQLYYPLDFPEVVAEWAGRHDLDPYLVYGIIRQESAFDTRAVSRAGARGLMQLMPATGRELAARLRLPYSRERLNDPSYNVRLGTRYLTDVLGMFDGEPQLALAGYNGGPYRIRRWWREAGPDRQIDRFVEGLSLSETTTYVKRILAFQDSYRQLYEGG